MLDLIRDLYVHQEWADAQHWQAVRAFQPALEHEGLRQGLFHIHAVQKVWLARWQGVDLVFPKPEDYPRIEDLYTFAKSCHAALRGYLSLRSELDLQASVTYQNIHGETFTQPLEDLLLHLPYHSQYHRGQTARAMVALGAHLPATDLVVWQRAGRPKADWTE
ncbi:MAG: DinB family protein [Holophagaceae bacterium]|nr:DinB family protein [Holophagaceae bacterium]